MRITKIDRTIFEKENNYWREIRKIFVKGN